MYKWKIPTITYSLGPYRILDKSSGYAIADTISFYPYACMHIYTYP